jgi:hypothetical protein
MGENDEKSSEKEREKQAEKTEEKSPEEKWQRDPLNTVTWAAILIWAGLVFLASNLGWLDSLVSRTGAISGWDWLDSLSQAWPLVLIGAGVILLIQVLIRLLVPSYRKPVLGTIILALIFIAIGLGDLINWGIVWAVILIILGVSIIVRGSRRKKVE